MIRTSSCRNTFLGCDPVGRNLSRLLASARRTFFGPPTALRRLFVGGRRATLHRETSARPGMTDSLLHHEPVGTPRSSAASSWNTRPALRPFFAIGVVVVHVRRHRPRPGYSATRAAMSSKAGRCQRAHQRAHRATLRVGTRRSSRLGTTCRRSAGRRDESASMSRSMPRVSLMISTVSEMTSRLRRPRKVHLEQPESSTPCISYCVTIGEASGSAPGSASRDRKYSVSSPS